MATSTPPFYIEPIESHHHLYIGPTMKISITNTIDLQKYSLNRQTIVKNSDLYKETCCIFQQQSQKTHACL